MVFAVNVILAISLLAVPRSVLSGVSPPPVCEDVQKLSITTVDQNIFSVNDERPVKDNKLIVEHDNKVKITVKMPQGLFNMVKSKVRTIRVIKIEWVCRDSEGDTIYKETETVTYIQDWQYTEIEDEKFLGCSDVQIKFTKSSNAKKMGIKALTMDTCKHIRVTCNAITPSGGVEMIVTHSDVPWGTGTCVSFSCPLAYHELIGDASSCCVLNGFNGDWTNLVPKCRAIEGCYAVPILADETYQFDSGSLTNVMCMNACHTEGYHYAITYEFWGFTCSCGNVLNPLTLSPGPCPNACPGDLTTRCGGSNVDYDYLTPTGL